MPGIKKFILKLQNSDQVEALWYLTRFLIDTGKKDLDRMINSITGEIHHKLDTKLESDSRSFKLTLKDHEVIALYTLWYEYSKQDLNFQEKHNAILALIMPVIGKRLA
jgi:hypothetical protein